MEKFRPDWREEERGETTPSNWRNVFDAAQLILDDQHLRALDTILVCDARGKHMLSSVERFDLYLANLVISSMPTARESGWAEFDYVPFDQCEVALAVLDQWDAEFEALKNTKRWYQRKRHEKSMEALERQLVEFGAKYPLGSRDVLTYIYVEAPKLHSRVEHVWTFDSLQIFLVDWHNFQLEDRGLQLDDDDENDQNL